MNDIIARAEKVYDRLVNETENRDTIHDQNKMKLLNVLLDIFEYVINDNENPMDNIFGEEV